MKEYKESVSPKVGELFRLRKEKNLLFFEKAAEAESEARAQKNNYYLAEVLLEKALMCYHHENDLDSTLSYMEQARELVGEDPVAYKTMSEYYRISGVINFFKGNVFKASELYDAGIRLLESLEKTDYHDLEILGSIYFNSTNLYRNIPRNHVRLSKMYKAYELFKKINYELGIARCLNSIAIYDDRYTEKIESEPLFLEAIEIFKHNNDERGCAVVKSNMGSMYCKNNRFNEGIKHLLEAYEMLKKIGHSSFIATCARQIATAYREHNEPRTALKYLQEAEAAVE